MFHGLCSRLAAATGSIWVSVAYRLAPEHRLPAGCEDCIAALACLGRPGFEPLSSRGDLELCFLAGDSVGGNLAHQVAISAAQSGGSGGVKILGVILMHPGFIKEERSRSEIENGPELALVSIEAVEKGSRLCLPEGTDKDYYVMNPWIPSIREVVVPPVLVIVGKKDIFYDRQIEYCREMKRVGQDVELVEYPEMGHCFLNYPQNESCPKAKDLVHKVMQFMDKCRLQAESCRAQNVGVAEAIPS
ncbi:hypothetical protein SUGI_0963010 [Cryptomeria japonica]|nr:hypothetical protein SUGI_0963010 [Cryptomeria japonica]